MKIVATVTNDLTTDQRMIRICSSLAKAGHEVCLVGRQLPDSQVLREQPFGQKRFRLFFKKGKLFYFEYNVRLFFFLLFKKWDVVHSVDLDSLFPAVLVSRLRRKLCVYDAHEYFTEVPEVIDRPRVKNTWEWVAQYCIPKVDSAVTVCGSLAKIFQQKYGRPFEVVRNVPFRKPPPPAKSFSETKLRILLYQGVLNEGRGLEEIILAMTDLPQVKLWLAGEGDLSQKLRKMVDELGLKQRVKFWGKLSPEQLSEVTLQADLGLNLLKNKGLNYYYSLANKAFDYIQAGLPSLNMAFPEYELLNEKFGTFYLLADLEKTSILEAVNELFSDEKKYQAMAENCRKAAGELIWEKEEKVLLKIYAEGSVK